jgi:hypothetical protein
MLRFTRVKVEAESTLNANISPGETELVHVVKLVSEFICWEARVGFSVPVIESESVGIVPAAFQTSITQSPVWFAIMVQPVIVPPYGITAYPLFPVVNTLPAPSMVTPNEPDNAPPETVPPPLPVGTTIGKVEPSPFVNVIVLPAIEAVVKSEPVSVVPLPPFKANEAVNAYEEEIDVLANDAVVTKDAVATLDADMAKLAVPSNEPVIPAVTESEPVTSEFPVERNPFFILNSFAISFHYPRLGL